MRHLRVHGFSRRVCRKKVVVKFENRKKTDWHGVGRKGGGQLSINGEKLYSGTSLYWAGQACTYVWRKRGEGWRPDLVKGNMDCKFSVMVWGCICYNGVGTLTKVLTNTSAFWRTISDRLLLDTFQKMTTYFRMTTRPYIELVRPRSM
jgi:hypothetical protein